MTRTRRTALAIFFGVASALAGYTFLAPLRPAADLARGFARLDACMTPPEVEAILGPPDAHDESADRRVVRGFDDVDMLPIKPLPPVDTVYWYQGRSARVRVEFRGGALVRAKLNTPGEAGVYRGGPWQ